MKKAILLFLIIFSGYNYTEAQEEKYDPDIGFVSGLLYSNQDFSGLNSRLAGIYPSTEINKNGLGVSWLMAMGKPSESYFNTFGTNLYFNSQNDNSSNYTFLLTNVSILADVHFRIFNKRNFFIHPFLGLGFNTAFLNITDLSKKSPDFDTALTQFNSLSLTTSFYTFLFDCGISFYLQSKKTDKSFLGFRAGYTIPLGKTHWEYANKFYQNTPDINTNRLYAGLFFLFY